MTDKEGGRKEGRREGRKEGVDLFLKSNNPTPEGGEKSTWTNFHELMHSAEAMDARGI